MSGTTAYDYDASGNRITYSSDITTTQTVTYTYDAADRLVESIDQNNETTTYEWDQAGRLITTTVAGVVSRVYGYNQAGDMVTAVVAGITTTFRYNGDGGRLSMSVNGEVVSYTLDYGGGGRILVETGGTFAQSKHYLYGLECLGEQVDAGETTASWRYYQRDGNRLVRQTSDEEAEITLVWTFSPQGAVLLGERGPVTNLECGAVYDWSTGLVFKRGRYFDPNTGIWTSLAGVVVWSGGRPSRLNRRQRRAYGRQRKPWLFLLLLFMVLLLAGCGGEVIPTPDIALPTDIPCPTDTPLPIPTPHRRHPRL